MKAKELTLKEHCVEQLGRLKNTLGFPEGRLAIQDYCNALAVMETFEGVTALMDDLTRTELIRMPQAATVRAMANDRMASVLASRRACLRCGGSGWVTVFYLASYHGRNWATMEKAERIRLGDYASEYEASVAVRNTLERPNVANVLQQVISAAKECDCRKSRQSVETS